MHHLITNPSDIYYLTGVRPHDPGEILILQTNSEGIVFCDARTSALFDSQKYQIIDDRKKWEEAFKQYPEIYTDPDFLTQTLREKIEKYGVQLRMQKSPVTQSRIIKTPEEIQKLRTSQEMNKKVYEQILPFLVPGVTEAEIARKIQIMQLELGGSGPSFPPIVAFGENTAVPHHNPTERKLLPEDIILLDMGLVYDGYCSDLTRCTSLKKKEEKGVNLISSRKDKREGSFDELYALLQKVTEEIISWAKPGMKVAELDKKAREMLGEYEQYFTHSLGHGVGIDIHEAPWISVRSDEVLQTGMIITIEPGVYLTPGLGNFNPGVVFGARYEEMVIVDKNELKVL